ncbi:hypothetical protein [uncultured Bifidobacterium sp.]|uniref:hypothetical protein n=1 Tax=uncultured Bifidobacterium sp. TaxID=165187 RepID=UPI0027DB71E9|nr:hypothetical protein [uncultured Bifidobacterium sp.]
MPFNPFASSDRPPAGPASSAPAPGPESSAAAPEPQPPAAAPDPADDWAAAWAVPAAEPEPAPPAVVPEPEPEPMPKPPANAGEPVAETVVSESDAGARADDPPSDPEPEWMSAARGFDEPDAAALWDESVADPTPESEPDPEPGAPAWVDAAREYEGAGPAASSPAGEPSARRGITVDAAAFDWAMPDGTDAMPRTPARVEAPDAAVDETDANDLWGVPDGRHDGASDDPWDMVMAGDGDDVPEHGRAFPVRIVLTVAAVIAAVALVVAGVLGVRRLVDVRAQREARESACATLADAVDRWDGLAAQADSLGVTHDGRPAGRECPTDTGKATRAAKSYDKASDALETLVSDAIGDQWAAIGDALSKTLDANPDMSADTRAAIESLLGSDAPATADDLDALREKADTLAGQAAEQQAKADEERKAAEEAQRAEDERRAAEEAQRQAEQQAQTPQYTPPQYTPSYTPQYTPQPQPQTPAPQPEPAPEPSGSADVTM